MGHEMCMRQKRSANRFMVGNLKEGNHLEELGIDRRIILTWI
jgi:hypothetical protein